jgi:hypothetical protein
MSSSIRTVYAEGRFDVYDGELHIIHQPFKPTDTGSQDPWPSEEEAMAWWDEQKATYMASKTENTEE